MKLLEPMTILNGDLSYFEKCRFFNRIVIHSNDPSSPSFPAVEPILVEEEKRESTNSASSHSESESDEEDSSADPLASAKVNHTV